MARYSASSPSSPRSRVVLSLAACLCWFPSVLCIAAEPRLEYEVKAAFLFNFTRFIEWPPSAFESSDSPLAICILGEDPFGKTLDHLVDNEFVNGRKVVLQRLRRPPNFKSCQVL